MPIFIMCWKYICITVSQTLVIWQLVLVFAWHNILTFGIHFCIAINLHPIVDKSMVVLNKSGISCTGSTSVCRAWWEFAFLWPSFSSCKWHYCLTSSVCCAWLETDKNLFHFITLSGCCSCCGAVSVVFHFLIVIGASISFCIVGLSLWIIH